MGSLEAEFVELTVLEAYSDFALFLALVQTGELDQFLIVMHDLHDFEVDVHGVEDVNPEVLFENLFLVVVARDQEPLFPHDDPGDEEKEVLHLLKLPEVKSPHLAGCKVQTHEADHRVGDLVADVEQLSGVHYAAVHVPAEPKVEQVRRDVELKRKVDRFELPRLKELRQLLHQSAPRSLQVVQLLQSVLVQQEG